MTPTALAEALRNVEVANEETNYAKFQSDAAIVEEAAEALERSIECKDLEWEQNRAYGVSGKYKVIDAIVKYFVTFRTSEEEQDWDELGEYYSIESAQAAANDHNKQQFQQIIEEWRKG